MAQTNRTDWTADEVANRFTQAAATGRRLPPVKVQGYFNTWPALAREAWETLSLETPRLPSFPPTPKALDQMMEAMRWIIGLAETQRHLVWMRAHGHAWHEIGKRLGCDRNTAYRRWQKAIQQVVDQLNRPSNVSQK